MTFWNAPCHVNLPLSLLHGKDRPAGLFENVAPCSFSESHVLNIVRQGVMLPPCSKTTHIQYQAWMLIIPNEQCYNMALMRRLEPIPPYYYSFVQKRCHSKWREVTRGLAGCYEAWICFWMWGTVKPPEVQQLTISNCDTRITLTILLHACQQPPPLPPCGPAEGSSNP